MTLKFELTQDIKSLAVNYENRGPLSKRLRVTVNGHKRPLVDFDDDLSDTESESEQVCGHPHKKVKVASSAPEPVQNLKRHITDGTSPIITPTQRPQAPCTPRTQPPVYVPPSVESERSRLEVPTLPFQKFHNPFGGGSLASSRKRKHK